MIGVTSTRKNKDTIDTTERNDNPADRATMTDAKPEGQPSVDEGHSTTAVSAEAENEMYSRHTKDTLRITYVGT